MKIIKSLVKANLKLVVSVGYAMAITTMVSLLLSWSRVMAILLVFIIIFELTYFVLHMESYNEDEQHKEDKDV